MEERKPSGERDDADTGRAKRAGRAALRGVGGSVG
jgi:hypothetical protein